MSRIVYTRKGACRDMKIEDLTTPAVLIDRTVLAKNITRMAESMAAKRINLRPHIKTHKIIEIAELQREAGATGLTVATIGEAEVFATAGFTDIFIAYPLWLTSATAARITALTSRCTLSFGVDSAEAAENAGTLLDQQTRGRLDVLIEIDSGHHRSGASADTWLDVAAAISTAGLRFGGVFTFPGHSYSPGAAASASGDESTILAAAADMLEQHGYPAPRRSGGSTPSALLADADGLTEARPGVYVFGDAQQLELGRVSADDISLSVVTTVVSRHDSDPMLRRIVVDAGSKVLGGDRPAWASGFGRILDHPDARITALSEHHGTIHWPADQPLPALGSRLRVIPNHVCLTLNLVDTVCVHDGDEVSDTWLVAARGRNN